MGFDDPNWALEDGSMDITCRQCREWVECPCGCDMGWCIPSEEFTRAGESC